MKHSFKYKISAAAGSAALLSGPVSGHAAPVTVNNAPLSVSVFDNVDTSMTWDIDGDGQSEFELRLDKRSGTIISQTTFPTVRFTTGSGTVQGTGFSYYRRSFTTAFVRLADQTAGGNPLNGRGLAAHSFANMAALNNSSAVGPSNYWQSPVGTGRNYAMSFQRTANIFMLQSTRTNRTTVGRTTFGPYIASHFAGFAPGDNMIGFRFDDGTGAGLNYGWAVLNFDRHSGSVTIPEWTYETEDDTAVHAGTQGTVVPVPASIVPAITLLGLGAAGMRKWRKQKRMASTKA